MDSGLLLRIFSSWEMIAACIFLILLLPLVFFIASTTSRPRIAPRIKKAPAARKRPEMPTEEGEPGEEDAPEETRRGARGRVRDEDQEENA